MDACSDLDGKLVADAGIHTGLLWPGPCQPVGPPSVKGLRLQPTTQSSTRRIQSFNCTDGGSGPSGHQRSTLAG